MIRGIFLLFQAVVFLGLGTPAFGATTDCASFLQAIQVHYEPSQALKDPLIVRARKLNLVEDFKILADLTPRPLLDHQIERIHRKAGFIRTAQGEKAEVGFLIRSLYTKSMELKPVLDPSLKPQWTVPQGKHKETFDHIEKMWQKLARRTPTQTKSSLLPLPNPFFIPGARFQEGYYWDTFFAVNALLDTGRAPLVRGQIENFLFLLKNYGLIPNGTRDYYLTRSQPPMLSEMVLLYIKDKQKKGTFSKKDLLWLRDEVYPLIKKDYEKFWMNPETRFDASTGLNHHYDDLDEVRPERHSSDNEEALGDTYRDVRAAAESGEDFTDACEGQETRCAGVLLNSLLFQVEKNLSQFAKMLGKTKDSRKFNLAAQERKRAVNKYLWDEKTKTFRNYLYDKKQHSPLLSADTFVPLYVGLASTKQAQGVMENLNRLERKGGLMASDVVSGKQWDAPFGWAPQHYFAITGMKRYGFKKDALRLAEKWIKTVDHIFEKKGKIIEKVDVTTGSVPVEDGGKYPTQEGFLWTNGVYAWCLHDILGVPLTSLE